MDYLLIK